MKRSKYPINAIEFIESGMEIVPRTEGIQLDAHLDQKSGQKDELGVN